MKALRLVLGALALVLLTAVAAQSVEPFNVRQFVSGSVLTGVPKPELCGNGIDDNGDGRIDEGCGGADPCATAGICYYVSTAGSDSNSCATSQTITTPKRNIAGAAGGLACLVAGKRLVIRTGTYTENISYNTQTIPAGTSFANAVTVAAYTGESVTLRGRIELGSSSNQYMIFDRLIVDATGLGVGDLVYVDNGAHHIRFQNGQVTGSNGTAGIALYGSGGFNEILTSRIHDNGVDTLHDHGIYLHSANNLVQGNEIDNNASAGIHFYNGGTDMGSGNIATGNLIHDNTGGMVAWDLTNAIISNNVMYNHPSQGISVNQRAPGIKIYNNTITGSGSYGIDIGASSGVVVQNNIFYGNVVNLNDNGVSTTKDHNLCNAGCNVNQDPLFVGGSDYSLQTGSPAINAGTSIGAVLVDILGVSQPQGGVYDIGAYER